MPAQRHSNAEVARRLAKRIAEQARRGIGKGLEAGLRFLVARIKETVSVSAPRRRAVSRRTGAIYYVAKTKAIKGAPPRKLSGTLRQRITSKMLSQTKGVLGVGVKYARRHELGKGNYSHPYIRPTVEKYRREFTRIVGSAVRFEFSRRRM